MSTIKTIVFDLGNVLFGFDLTRAAEGFLRLEGMNKNPDELMRFFEESPVETAYTEGKVSTEEFFTHVREGIGITCSLAEFSRAYCDIFIVKYDSFELVRTLKEAGYRLLVLSNTNTLHFEFLRSLLDWVPLFDDLVLSYEVFCQKPQEQIYDIIIDRAGGAPGSIFFADDLAENIAAAEAKGIVGHQFTDAACMRRALSDVGVSVL